jgi:hypothetical protein
VLRPRGLRPAPSTDVASPTGPNGTPDHAVTLNAGVGTRFQFGPGTGNDPE